MTALLVTYSKLARYCEMNGGYDLERRGAAVSLSFVPNFPEATEKADSVLPRIHMSGKVIEDKVEFTAFETEDSNGIRFRNSEEAEVVYKGWIDYIEDNF